MTREEYISALKNALRALPEPDITDIAQDFEEHFSIGLSQGKTEHEIAAELGDPTIVAGTYFEESLEDIGHTMKESAAHTAAAAAASSSANRAAIVSSGTSSAYSTDGSSGTTQAAAPVKDLSGARLFVILLNVLVTWWAALTIYCTLLSFWCVSLSLMAGGIAAFAGLSAASGQWTAVLVLSGIAGVMMAAATGILNYFLSKWTVIGSKAYINWNKKLYNKGF